MRPLSEKEGKKKQKEKKTKDVEKHVAKPEKIDKGGNGNQKRVSAKQQKSAEKKNKSKRVRRRRKKTLKGDKWLLVCPGSRGQFSPDDVRWQRKMAVGDSRQKIRTPGY